MIGDPTKRPGQPVSRILSGGNPAWMDIYLGCRLPDSSRSLPGDGWEPGGSRLRRGFSPACPCTAWGLPGRGHCCPRRWSLTPPFHPYSPCGERFVFCGPVPNVYTLPGVTRHVALWCADFPRVPCSRVHPVDLVIFDWNSIIRLNDLICVRRGTYARLLHLESSHIKNDYATSFL